MKAREIAQQIIYRVINPVVHRLVKAGVTPNMVTATGLFFNIVACAVLISGAVHSERGDFSCVGWAGGLILFAGLFDMLDGQVARIGKMTSRYGALFDSVLDRYGELVVLFGCCYYLILQGYFAGSLFGFVAMIGSIMVSYVRARAEGLGIECKGGFMQRPERIVTISAGAIACGVFHFFAGNCKVHVPHLPFPVFEPVLLFVIPLVIVAVFANITAIGRLNHCRKVLTRERPDHEVN
jgi:CDP-diacylglycerol--glycerol-3-phosphate 3-phosphatidyltransferase